ncbi:MAG: Cof-type HAD-IIB family hydrolase [Faecalicatena sp.]|uniref:Cof-type HAD-IIB family hydrolase n=1 Tax=Faecalicatena sp. TaxID=2005360 RepID=UPI00258EC5A5|nr:Cof-type HAD-IIB family hydrolase [Faecalicatena sp.]MCI6465601.1 Cof-type HAD-IIB family hydrolase [Faecalicatena sp.]MDY5617433.1 Cof-type HAD-IIB family hydrolase [Lachnospiraceae bacterium]
MIKVIASDMDGTLLDDHHKLSKETLAAIDKACKAGLRFIIATGRNFRGAMEELKDVELTCDYIVGSGAEVRNPDKEVVFTAPIDLKLCEEVYRALQKYPVSIVFCTDAFDYRIGDKDEIEAGFIHQLRVFHLAPDIDEEQAKKDPIYQRIRGNTKILSDFSELRLAGVPVYKIFLYSEDISMLDKIREELQNHPAIAVAASFETNLEITDVRAQKGPVLKEYIESLGHTMDEVMVFGDSMNDYSMLSMDFGATIAMENSMPEVKKAAKYITKSNEESGVAYAIEELLRKYGL